MGDRPLVDIDDARASLLVGGRLQADARIGAYIRWTSRSRIAFATYETRESDLLARLQRGDPAEDILKASPFPTLSKLTWGDVAHLYRARIDGTACGEALAWFGDALLRMSGTRLPRPRERPWKEAFDRAEARSALPLSRSDEMVADTIVNDWVSDALWGLDWVERGSFETATKELATRVAVSREIIRQLRSLGVRVDRAAAEAVAVVELAGAAPLWTSVVRAML